MEKKTKKKEAKPKKEIKPIVKKDRHVNDAEYLEAASLLNKKTSRKNSKKKVEKKEETKVEDKKEETKEETKPTVEEAKI